jgi:hypothetical protein
MLHLKSVADHRNDAVMRILIVKVVAMVPTRRRNPWAGLSAEPPIEIHRGVEVCPWASKMERRWLTSTWFGYETISGPKPRKEPRKYCVDAQTLA